MEIQFTDTQMDWNKVNSLEQQIFIKQSIKEIIKYIGDDPESEHCLDTPSRVLKSFNELYGGYKKDPKEALGTVFKNTDYDQIVILKDIEMYSTCSHHMIPFFGKVHIGYIPNEVVVGLSKLARLVEVFSRRLQVQERLTQQIANSIDEILKPKGVMVVIEAKHMCMCARGISKQHSSMITSSIKGLFSEEVSRSEFLRLIK